MQRKDIVLGVVLGLLVSTVAPVLAEETGQEWSAFFEELLMGNYGAWFGFFFIAIAIGVLCKLSEYFEIIGFFVMILLGLFYMGNLDWGQSVMWLTVFSWLYAFILVASFLNRLKKG